MAEFWAKYVYLGERWARDVRITVSRGGLIDKIEENAKPVGERLSGPLLPPMPNVHSHAFQRVMAGLAESASDQDNFWTWREEMYRLARRITPDLYLPIARYVFMEMLESGYGAVAEFHYLHGKNPQRMAEAIIEAARQMGIRLTLVPVFYAHSDFGGKPPNDGQKPFVLSIDQYGKLFQSIESPKGVSFHSLRAATIEEIKAILPLAGTTTPIHTHIAEQMKEVRDCMAFHRRRPVEYLVDHIDLDKRWTLIHATHVSENELTRIVLGNATIGVCPTTESNLGDGFFKAMRYRRHKGRFGIGTDSQVTIDPAQELRTLEYHQRLNYQLRNLLHGRDNDVAHYLYGNALIGGAQALGQQIGRISPGYPADFVVLDEADPLIGVADVKTILPRALFAMKAFPVKDVYVSGKLWVKDGIHVKRQKARKDFVQVLKTLYEAR